MKIQFVTMFITVHFCTMFAVGIQKSHSLNELQWLKKKIGNTLIGVSKKHPDTQAGVYQALDDMNALCNMSRKTVKKKRRYKALHKKDEQEVSDLKIEVRKLRRQSTHLEGTLQDAEKKYQEEHDQLRVITKERDELQEKNKELAKLQKKNVQRVKALEESFKSNIKQNQQSYMSTSTQMHGQDR